MTNRPISTIRRTLVQSTALLVTLGLTGILMASSAEAQDQLLPGDGCFGLTHFPDDPIDNAPTTGRVAFTLEPTLAGSEVAVLTDGVKPDGSSIGATGMVSGDGIVDLAFGLYSFGPLAFTAAVVAPAGTGLDPAIPETMSGPEIVDIDLSFLKDVVIDSDEPACDPGGLTKIQAPTTTTTNAPTTVAPTTVAPTTTPTSTLGGTRTRDQPGGSTGGRGFPWVPSGLAIFSVAFIGVGVYYSKIRKQGWNYSLRIEEWHSEETPLGRFPWFSAYQSMVASSHNPWWIDLKLECRLYVVFRKVRNGVPETSHVTVEIHGSEVLGGKTSAPGAPSAALPVKRLLTTNFDKKQFEKLQSHTETTWLEFDFAKVKRSIVKERTVKIEEDQEKELHGEFIYAVAIFAEKKNATSELWKAAWKHVDDAAAAGIAGISTAAGAAATPETGPVGGYVASKATSAALTTIYDSVKKGLEDQDIALIMPTGSYFAGKTIPLIDRMPSAAGVGGVKSVAPKGLHVSSDYDYTFGEDDAPNLVEALDVLLPKGFQHFPEPSDNETYWDLEMSWRANLYIIRG